AEAAAKAAAEGRQQAEAQTADAHKEADAARQDATSARETATRAQAEAEGIRKKAEAEVNRLEAALGQIAETRRTALGLVMNVGSDHLKFEFDDAEPRSLARPHRAIPDRRAAGKHVPRVRSEPGALVDAEVVAGQLQGELRGVADRRGVAGPVPGRADAEELAERRHLSRHAQTA